MKYEKSNLIHKQTNDNLVILTHINILPTFLKKCEKSKKDLHKGTEWVSFTKILLLIVVSGVVKLNEIQ